MDNDPALKIAGNQAEIGGGCRHALSVQWTRSRRFRDLLICKLALAPGALCYQQLIAAQGWVSLSFRL